MSKTVLICGASAIRMDRAKVLGIVKRLAPQSVIDRLIGGLVASAMKQPA